MTILKAENISKQYRLGNVGTGTLSHDLNRFWHKIRGKEDPYLKVGAVNDRSSKAKEEYVWALRDINFEVQEGEVLGIIGKNGAGKSTLLKILSRVTSPTTGVIKTKGRIASLLEVGTGFHPELTGRENIYLNGAILGMTRAEITAKLDEIVEFSGCELYIDTPVKRYSSGMTVRLAFAVAAHLEPDILVVDEVLAVGDAEFQKKAIGKMQDISKGEGRTVLFVSHNMGTILALTKKCLILEKGRIYDFGETSLIVEKYLQLGISDNKRFQKDFKINKSLPFINNIEFLNSENLSCKTFVSGQYLEIKIEILNETEFTFHKCYVGLAIFNLSEIMLTSFRSDLSDKYYSIEPGKNYIHCIIDKLPFSDGQYTYNVVLKDFSTTFHRIAGAGILEIEAGVFYNSGKIPASNVQSILVEQNWK
ncbi:ABC transporter ATP-binding protein [Mesoflavibacter zeaxanthinifaciens]|uniref:ABC transporter ATP-binding protein n=1 Tax=Mesoflavibacter zeaxanthinifaciens TaxID=393060 RepID=UPI003A8F9460